MRLIEKNGLRILYAAYGYVLKRKDGDDVYGSKIYLGVNTSLDIFEEVEDPSKDDSLLIAINDVESKEQSLTKVAKIVANQVTDDIVALSIQEFYDEWTPDTTYLAGRYVKYNDILYKALAEHTSQESWTPDVSPGLFAKVLIDPTGETIPEWVKPDSTNAYMTGDKVMFEGKKYESVMDNNIWSPAEYPSGWNLVE